VPGDVFACDHLEEQLFPNETWGKTYAVSALNARGTSERPQTVRIISQRDANTLTFTGIPTPSGCAMLNKGGVCEFTMTTSFMVNGTQPLLVMQLMGGQGDEPLSCASNPSSPQCMGDPASVTEVPVDQFRDSYDFLVPDTYNRNIVNVVMPTNATVTLDNGTPVLGSSQPVGPDFKVVWLPVTPGKHHIESTSRFGIKVYGIARYTSYMYPGGLDLEQISPPG
jgi:hypothetical protein